MIFLKKTDTPIGNLYLACDEKDLLMVAMDNNLQKLMKDLGPSKEEDHPILTRTQKQLKEYFNKKREKFDLPVRLTGSDFEKRVWSALCRIPYAKTITYSSLARMISNPKAARAVGNANSKNPISIIVPCHRVINKNGFSGGYAGGREAKKFLLDLERNKSRKR